MNKGKKNILIRFISMLITVSVMCVLLVSCGNNAGIPAGNLLNYGYVLVDGDDVYYSKILINDGDYYSCIYKYNSSTSEDVLISALYAEDDNVMNSFLTLEKGNLYFLTNYLHESHLEASENISYIKPDGKVPEEVQKIFETDDISARYMQIVKGVLYYYDDWEEAIYRINLNGTGKKLICEAEIYSDSFLTVANNKVYFGEDTMILEVSINGGTPKVIFDSEEEYEDDYYYIGYLAADNKFIYYMDDDKSFIRRISLNGKNDTLVYEAPAGMNIESFNVSDGVVYFVTDTNDIYEIMSITPGAANPTVVVDRNNGYGDILPISIWGNTIYFLAMPAYETIMESDYVWFTVNKSGGRITAMRPFTVSSDIFEDDEWDDE